MRTHVKTDSFCLQQRLGWGSRPCSESAGPPRYITLKYRTSDCAFCGQVYLYVCEWMSGYLWNCLKHMHAAPRISQYWTPPALKVPERSSWGVEGSEWSNYFMAQIQLSRGGTFIYTVFISVQRRPNSTVHHVTDWKLDWTTQLEPCLTRLKQLLCLGITETHFRDLIIFTVVVPN